VVLEIQSSVRGLPEEKTTTVGLPVSMTALSRALCAPTRPRSLFVVSIVLTLSNRQYTFHQYALQW
jgi:hypothetical protein